ncbi:unnamed protein product [Durusdinium trenchii]|uniref:Uncharacterized protein n=1 Tax=Durusdinium trenchii TaxID=1381693 RepID=A0ABP0MMT5_9DINO
MLFLESYGGLVVSLLVLLTVEVASRSGQVQLAAVAAAIPTGLPLALCIVVSKSPRQEELVEFSDAVLRGTASSPGCTWRKSKAPGGVCATSTHLGLRRGHGLGRKASLGSAWYASEWLHYLDDYLEASGLGSCERREPQGRLIHLEQGQITKSASWAVLNRC